MKLIKKMLLLLVAVFFMLGCTDAGWEFISPMPNERYGHDATLGPDGKIYVMGGMVFKQSIFRKYNNGRYSSLVYDPNKGKWRVLEPVPGWVRGNLNLVMIFNKKINDWDWVKKVSDKKNYYKNYDPTTKTYKIEKYSIPPTKIRNTNLQRQGDGVAIVTGKDGRIYWIGGNGRWSGRGEDIVLPYDSAKARWPEAVPQRKYLSSSASSSGSASAWRTETVFKTKIPPMNERRMDHEAVVTADGKIFVFGGRVEEEIPKKDNEYHISEKMRTAKGGYFKENWWSIVYRCALDTMECYDPTTNMWAYRKPMKVRRFLFAAVVGPDDSIYTFGGYSDFGKNGSYHGLSITEIYDPATDTWSSRAPMPEPRGGIAAVYAADGKIYVMGGSKGGRHDPPTKDVFIYDPVNDSWDTGPSMNLPRATLAAVSTPDGKIYAIGGTDVGAYKSKQKLNFFLPEKKELYTGMVQDTVEVLDISK